MKDKPLVSVLMPVYNAERYVKEAVESILAQTFKDFEFLITDDGSTDRSLEILKHYAAKDPRIQLTSRPNAGLVATLNEMLEKAQGEFIARMDADDIAMPERFSLQIEFLRNNPDVVCVGGAHELIDEKGRLLTRLAMPKSDDEIQRLALAGHTTINHPSAMICKSSVIEVGGYDSTMLPAEDLDLWLRLGEIGKLANLENVILKYRLHTNSISEKNRCSQRQSAQKACELAWERRGIKGCFEATKPWRPGEDRSSQCEFMLKYGWWAFNSGQRKTAMIYGVKAILAFPFTIDGWKLIGCVLFKQFPDRYPRKT